MRAGDAVDLLCVASLAGARESVGYATRTVNPLRGIICCGRRNGWTEVSSLRGPQAAVLVALARMAEQEKRPVLHFAWLMPPFSRVQMSLKGQPVPRAPVSAVSLRPKGGSRNLYPTAVARAEEGATLD